MLDPGAVAVFARSLGIPVSQARAVLRYLQAAWAANGKEKGKPGGAALPPAAVAFFARTQHVPVKQARTALDELLKLADKKGLDPKDPAFVKIADGPRRHTAAAAGRACRVEDVPRRARVRRGQGQGRTGPAEGGHAGSAEVGVRRLRPAGAGWPQPAGCRVVRAPGRQAGGGSRQVLHTEAMRLLVVDDDEAVRRSVAHALRRDGFEVAVAADGAAALERLSRVRHAAVVLDVLMPEPNGLEVCLRQCLTAYSNATLNHSAP